MRVREPGLPCTATATTHRKVAPLGNTLELILLGGGGMQLSQPRGPDSRRAHSATTLTPPTAIRREGLEPCLGKTAKLALVIRVRGTWI